MCQKNKPHWKLECILNWVTIILHIKTCKGVLREKFTLLNACSRKDEKINNPRFYLKKLEKNSKLNPPKRRRKIIKTKAEITEMKNKL